MAEKIEMLPVKSTNLAKVGYDKEGRMLAIQFKSKITYEYFNVSPFVFQGLLKAKSKGTYFNKSIRYKFKYREAGKTGRPKLPKKPR